MTNDFSLKNLVIAIISYFILIEVFSWIGGEIFYDFDKVPSLFLNGHFIKGILMFIIIFVAYTLAGTIATGVDDEKYSPYILCLIFIISIGSDIYDFCTSDDILQNMSMGLAVLFYSWDDVLKLITLLLIIVGGRNKEIC